MGSSKSRQNSRIKSNAGTTCTDSVLLDVFNSMMIDFNRLHNTTIFSRWKCNTIKDFRNIEVPSVLHTNYRLVKSHVQTEKFFGRYVSENDALTPSVVEQNTFDGYMENVLHVASLAKRDFSSCSDILGAARKRVKAILGKLDLEKVFESVRFGKRASIGIPLAQSYLDCKMTYPISCDPNLVELFERYLSSDPIMQEVLQNGIQIHGENDMRSTKPYTASITHVPVYKLTRSINLSLVPKKFNKLRPVTPYSTASTLLSLAVGDYMTTCLKEHGLDLSKLQAVHRKMIAWMSKSDSYGTADLTAASEGITWMHVRRLVDPDWYNLLRKFQVRTVTHRNEYPWAEIHDQKIVMRRPNEERSFHTETFLGMGSGITFPLQTLFFYALVESIREKVQGDHGFTSVYGDDLIYPTRIHSEVLSVFAKLGFKLNQAKTYMSSRFRESCGEDCFNGFPVRPFSYEGVTEYLRGAPLGAFLFKIFNGLRERWKEKDLTTTFHTLRRWISASYGYFPLVPAGFPSYSGYRTSTPANYEEWFVPVLAPVWRYSRVCPGNPTHSTKSGMDDCRQDHKFSAPNDNSYTGWQFSAISAVSDNRFVEYVFPYYWEWMRKSTRPPEVPDPFAEKEDIPDLRWITLKDSYRKIRNKRVKRLHPVVSRKKSVRMRLQKFPIGDWEREY